MLVQVTLENVLSFRDEVTFSMLGVKSDHSHEDHLFVDVAGKGRSVLPIAAIYGANASGKSNFIEAIAFAKDMIVEGTRAGQRIPVSSFKLGDYFNKPSKFEFIFVCQGNIYNYGFRLNTTRVLEEWLYVTPPEKNREQLVFERITDDKDQAQVKYGSSLKGRSKKQILFLDLVAQGTRYNQLFLTEAVDRNVETVLPVTKWFINKLTIIPAESRFKILEKMSRENQEFIDFFENILRISGTGINSVVVEEESNTILDLEWLSLPPFIRDVYSQDIESLNDNEILTINLESKESSSKQIFFKKSKNGEGHAVQIKIKLGHRHENGSNVYFSVEEESDGTQRLIHLIPALFMIKNNSQRVVLLDEIDRRLHPLLSRQFIEVALQCHKGDSYNQFIFTTHDTNLLDRELFRKDEIWFVEKNEQGASQMYSLAEFKIDPNIQLEKGYLNGRFGAIPFLGDVKSLGWLDCEPEVNQKVDSLK
jgi:uncharacterized protein